MAEIIKTDGTRQPVQPANGTDFKLEEMQAISRRRHRTRVSE